MGSSSEKFKTGIKYRPNMAEDCVVWKNHIGSRPNNFKQAYILSTMFFSKIIFGFRHSFDYLLPLFRFYWLPLQRGSLISLTVSLSTSSPPPFLYIYIFFYFFFVRGEKKPWKLGHNSRLKRESSITNYHRELCFMLVLWKWQ